MSTGVIVTVAVGCVGVAWCAWSFSWSAKQTLVGTWAALLPDGTDVTLQFEGERGGGLYKQLSKRNGAELREFGHWTMKVLELRLIIMATDVKEHPRFGVDTQYWVNFGSKDQVTINGPERPKWILRRAADGLWELKRSVQARGVTSCARVSIVEDVGGRSVGKDR
jgi:hypothetical protein